MTSFELWYASILETKTFQTSQLLVFPKLASLTEILSCVTLISPFDVHKL